MFLWKCATHAAGKLVFGSQPAAQAEMAPGHNAGAPQPQSGSGMPAVGSQVDNSSSSVHQPACSYQIGENFDPDDSGSNIVGDGFDALNLGHLGELGLDDDASQMLQQYLLTGPEDAGSTLSYLLGSGGTGAGTIPSAAMLTAPHNPQAALAMAEKELHQQLLLVGQLNESPGGSGASSLALQAATAKVDMLQGQVEYWMHKAAKAKAAAPTAAFSSKAPFTGLHGQDYWPALSDPWGLPLSKSAGSMEPPPSVVEASMIRLRCGCLMTRCLLEQEREQQALCWSAPSQQTEAQPDGLKYCMGGALRDAVMQQAKTCPVNLGMMLRHFKCPGCTTARLGLLEMKYLRLLPDVGPVVLRIGQPVQHLKQALTFRVMQIEKMAETAARREAEVTMSQALAAVELSCPLCPSQPPLWPAAGLHEHCAEELVAAMQLHGLAVPSFTQPYRLAQWLQRELPHLSHLCLKCSAGVDALTGHLILTTGTHRQPARCGRLEPEHEAALKLCQAACAFVAFRNQLALDSSPCLMNNTAAVSGYHLAGLRSAQQLLLPTASEPGPHIAVPISSSTPAAASSSSSAGASSSSAAPAAAAAAMTWLALLPVLQHGKLLGAVVQLLSGFQLFNVSPGQCAVFEAILDFLLVLEQHTTLHPLLVAVPASVEEQFKTDWTLAAMGPWVAPEGSSAGQVAVISRIKLDDVSMQLACQMAHGNPSHRLALKKLSKRFHSAHHKLSQVASSLSPAAPEAPTAATLSPLAGFGPLAKSKGKAEAGSAAEGDSLSEAGSSGAWAALFGSGGLTPYLSGALQSISSTTQSHVESVLESISSHQKWDTRFETMDPGSQDVFNQHVPEQLKEDYTKAMQALQFQAASLLGPGVQPAFYFRTQLQGINVTGGLMKQRMKKMTADISALQSCLPLAWQSSIFVAQDEERADAFRCVIFPAQDTPYANGAFLFDVMMPADYPNRPPKVQFLTTGGGHVRFNPNLYETGKVCLSLLGTWMGPPWNPKDSTLLQVLVSLQAMIFTGDPYFLEPSFESSKGSPQGDSMSQKYNQDCRLNTMRHAILGALEKPCTPFQDIIRQHFRFKQAVIVAQCKAWTAASEGYSFSRLNMQSRQADMADLSKKIESALRAL